jgi:phosphate uptake regulator
MAEKDLGYRRVQRTGRGSYIISLPKGWIQDIGLKKGSEIDFNVQPDSSLTLVPRKLKEKYEEDEHAKFKEYYINVDLEKEDLQYTLRMIKALYVISADILRIHFKGAEDVSKCKTEIKNFAHHDANRLSLYAVRQLKFGIERNLFRELGFRTPKEFLLYRIIVNDIKNIGENALNIINNLATFQKQIDDQVLFIKEPIDEEVYSQMLNFNSLAHQLFEEATKAMFKRAYNDAEKIITKRGSFVPLENELIRLMSSKKLDPNVAAILRLMLDSSRRIMDYAQDIAELTLNRTVEEICTNFEVK